MRAYDTIRGTRPDFAPICLPRHDARSSSDSGHCTHHTAPLMPESPGYDGFEALWVVVKASGP